MTTQRERSHPAITIKELKETISKLKVLVREAFHDGYEWHDEYEDESWADSETKEDLEEL